MKILKDVISILNRDPALTMRIYSMFDDKKRNIQYFINKSAIIVHSWSLGMYAEDPEDIIPLLQKIPSDKKLFLNGIPRNLLPIIQDQFSPDRLDISDECHLWTLEESPDEILCESLTHEDAPYVNKQWAYRSENSLGFIKWCLKTLPSSVIRDQNKPAGWSFCYSRSPYHMNMGGLLVLPQFRRKGYGRRITIDLSTKVFQCDRKPLVHVHITNHASQKLLKGLNFIQGEEIVFGSILPQSLTK